MAQCVHHCDYCHHDIQTGDDYEASVWVHGRRVIVFKQHCICPVDPMEEEDELIRRMMEEEDREETQEETLAEAA